MQAALIAQGANIGVTEEAEALLHERGVLCLPDFISNAGGVICGAIEYRGGTEQEAFAVIDEKIRRNTATVLERAAADKTLPRQAAAGVPVLAEHAALVAMGWREPVPSVTDAD